MASRASPVNFQQSNSSSEGMPAEVTCTHARAQRIALKTFASLAILGGVALISLSAAGIIAWPIAFCSIPLFALAVGGLYWSGKIIDYQNPIELQHYRDEAVPLSFPLLVKKHGLENLWRITSPDQLHKKFLIEFGSDSLSALLKKYSLYTIKRYGLLPNEELRQKFTREFLSMRQLDDSDLNWLDLLQYNIIWQDLFNRLHDLYEEKSKEDRRWKEVTAEIDLKHPNRREHLLEQIRKKRNAIHEDALYAPGPGFAVDTAALTALDAQEELISTNELFAQAQQKFDEELDLLYREHFSILAELNVRFEELQNSYRKSAFEPVEPELASM